MVDPYLGQIGIVAFSYAPYNWSVCDGQILQIGDNTALYSLLSTTFGGNGVNTFALPDFRGRVPIGAGSGPGLINVNWGDRLGTNFETLSVSQLPAHTHTANISSATVSIPATTANGTQTAPAAGFNLSTAVGSSTKAAPSYIYSDGEADVFLGNGVVTGGAVTVDETGENERFHVMQPSLGVVFAISTAGTYPPRP